jgi:hypothetical protein
VKIFLQKKIRLALEASLAVGNSPGKKQPSLPPRSIVLCRRIAGSRRLWRFGFSCIEPRSLFTGEIAAG